MVRYLTRPPTRRNRIAASSVDDVPIATTTTSVDPAVTRKDRHRTVAPMSQLQVQLHQCRHLQMVYLHAQAQHTFEAQEKKAKEDLYAMALANLRLKQEINEMEKSIQMRSAEMAVDMLLRAQVDGMADIEEKLPQLTVAMSQLTSSVKSAGKYMKMENVVIDEEKHMMAMKETKKLLAEVTALTTRNQPGFEGLYTAASELKEAVMSQLVEQRTCIDLLNSYKSLVNEERSLQAQLIQDLNVEK